MTEKERIKSLRKSLNLTLEEFGKRLGVGKSAISDIERGRNNISVQMIRSICREFNVSETWLRTGEGEMYVALPRAEALEADLRRILTPEGDSIRERLISALLKLEPEQWEVIERYAMEIVGNRAAPPEPDPEQEIEAKVEAYRQKLLAEKKGSFSAFPAAEPYPEELPDILA